MFRTPLHWAIKEQQKDAVDLLLQFGASVDANDRWGKLAIDYATEGSVTQKALNHFRETRLPARASRIHREKTSSEVPSEDVGMLFEAVRGGDTDRIKERWLGRADLNVRDSSGRTSLHIAAEHGQIGVVELLLSAGAEIDAIDYRNRSPLSIAYEKKLGSIAELLQNFHDRSTYRLNSSRKEGLELHPQLLSAYQATRLGELGKIRLLVPNHVSPNIQDYDLRSLLHVASAEGHMEIVKYLVDCGSNVNVLDRWGSSPLSEAIHFAHNDVARYLTQQQATEFGELSPLAVEDIDMHILHSAFEFVLRVAAQVGGMLQHEIVIARILFIG